MDKLVSQEALSRARRRSGRGANPRTETELRRLVCACTSWATWNETPKLLVRVMPPFLQIEFKILIDFFCLNSCDPKRATVTTFDSNSHVNFELNRHDHWLNDVSIECWILNSTDTTIGKMDVFVTYWIWIQRIRPLTKWCVWALYIPLKKEGKIYFWNPNISFPLAFFTRTFSFVFFYLRW